MLSLGIGLGLTMVRSGGSWTPVDTGDCVLWLRADLGVTVDGSTKVTGWADQSESGDTGRNVVRASTDGPVWNETDATYNNQATIGPFDIDDTKLRTGAWDTTYDGGGSGNAVTLLVVGHSAAAGNRYFTHEGGADFISILNNAGAHRVYSDDTTNSIVGDGGTGMSTAKDFGMVEFNGAASKLFKNSTSTALETGTLGATTLGSAAFGLGSFNNTGTSFGVLRIAEVIAWSRVLTADEKTSLRDYLTARYAGTYT
jgi:hypothetical protein